jgi:hypothetical protein
MILKLKTADLKADVCEVITTEDTTITDDPTIMVRQMVKW